LVAGWPPMLAVTGLMAVGGESFLLGTPVAICGLTHPKAGHIHYVLPAAAG
jgi:hypothetical protein